ncbi:hypothetical protein ACE3MZ_07975 [Paenibacillus sp. WLX1005]
MYVFNTIRTKPSPKTGSNTTTQAPIQTLDAAEYGTRRGGRPGWNGVLDE